MGIKINQGSDNNHRNQINQTNHSSDIMLQNNSILKSPIDKFWNNFRSGGISNPLTDIEQIELFMSGKKSTDSRITLRLPGFSGLKVPEPYRVKIAGPVPIFFGIRLLGGVRCPVAQW